MNGHYVCIEGNIGAGKTTFTQRYAELTGSQTIYEQFSDNPFLELFYKNPKQYAFPLEMSFLSERFQQLNSIFSKPDLFANGYVSDYTFIKTLIFAKNNLEPGEFELFRTFYNILNQKLPKPQMIVFLHTDIEYIQDNIKIRGREFEQKIATGYLEEINSTYKTMLLSKHDLPIVLLSYNQASWKSLDKTISQLHNDLVTNNLKKGLQLISS